MQRRRTDRAGFTLLEMLFALGMMSMLAGALYSALHVAFRARSITLRALNPPRRAELAMEMLRPMLAAALPPTGILAGECIGTDEVSETGEDLDSLVLYVRAARGGLLGSPAGTVRVELALSDPEGQEGHRKLVRRMTANLLAPEEPEPVEEVLCRGVVALDLWYSDGTSWLETWDSPSMDNSLPVAVEVTLTLAPEAGAPEGAEGYAATRVFAIPCGGMAPEQPAAGAGSGGASGRGG